MKLRTGLWMAMATLLGLLVHRTAEASAVVGCSIDAEVTAVQTSQRGAATEVTLQIRVLRTEGFGHSAGPAHCDVVGALRSFEVDNDVVANQASLHAGDRIRLEEMTVFNESPRGPSIHHSQTYEGRLPAAASP